MASLAQLQTWLSEAETARHALAMGASVAEVWRDGRRMTFRSSDLAALTGYIEELERKIEQAEAEAAGRPRRSAIRVTF